MPPFNKARKQAIKLIKRGRMCVKKNEREQAIK